MAKPLTAAERQRILDLHGEGKSRNDIARITGRSPGSVSRICADEGLTFDRTEMKQVTAARTADLAAARTSLADKMVRLAHRTLDDMDKPYTVHAFAGKAFVEHELAEPPVEVKRNALTIAGIAFDKATRIVERDDTEKTAEAGRSMVQTLMSTLASTYGAGDSPATDEAKPDA